MTNFLFKSPTTYKKLANNIEVLLNEQRHQRSDLASCLRKLDFLINDKNLQKTVDQYYDKHPDRELDDEDT